MKIKKGAPKSPLLLFAINKYYLTITRLAERAVPLEISNT